MKNDRNIDIMGILNLTDDSFYAGSRCQSAEAALSRVASMLEQGADIIDIGACSTRPGSEYVSFEEEWKRLEPVLSSLKLSYPDIKISIDTFRSGIVQRAYEMIGHFIVNDISAGEEDSRMLSTVGASGLGYVAMHKRGNPLTMQSLAEYDDVVDDVRSYFEEFSSRAADAGVRDWILDPGFGFAKTIEQNYSLVSRLSELAVEYAGYKPRILVGISRKSLIYRPLGITPEESLSATQALHMAALINGADILRVHDVRETVQTITVYKNLQQRLF